MLFVEVLKRILTLFSAILLEVSNSHSAFLLIPPWSLVAELGVCKKVLHIGNGEMQGYIRIIT